MAAGEGIEPSFLELESSVLPLDDPALLSEAFLYVVTETYPS